jgi:hypothetical protein
MRTIVGGTIVEIKVFLSIYYFDILKTTEIYFINFKKKN